MRNNKRAVWGNRKKNRNYVTPLSFSTRFQFHSMFDHTFLADMFGVSLVRELFIRTAAAATPAVMAGLFSLSLGLPFGHFTQVFKYSLPISSFYAEG